jgi:hypothetical protein
MEDNGVERNVYDSGANFYETVDNSEPRGEGRDRICWVEARGRTMLGHERLAKHFADAQKRTGMRL